VWWIISWNKKVAYNTCYTVILGWKFSTPEETPGCIPDPVLNAKFVSEIYLKADPNYSARFTVPILFDKQLETIVNNESSEIIRMFNDSFNEFAKNPHLDLYPANWRDQIDSVNTWIYDQINNGVYKTGFATAQDVYEKNCRALFAGLDKVEEILSKNKYIVGDLFTEADVRLFTTLIRFDAVYVGHFKCNLKTLREYPHIMRWLKDVYHIDGVKDTINMDHIKKHYYMSHKQINPTQIVPLYDGPVL
jgi:putative glutathione S-transferase